MSDWSSAFDGNTEALARVFGNVEGLANVLGVATSQAEDYVRIADEMNRTTNFLETGFENSSKKIGFVFRQAVESSKNSLIELGDAVAPLVTKLAKGITTITGVFNNLDDGTKKNLVSMAAFAAGSGVALKGLSLLTNGLVGGIGQLRNMTQLLKGAGGAILKFDDHMRGNGKVIKTATGSIKKLATAYKGLSAVTQIAIPVAVIGAAFCGLSSVFQFIYCD